MIQPDNPTLFCADAGPLRAAISPESTRHQVYGGKIQSQSDIPCQENQRACTAWHHTVVRFAHQAMQP